MITLRSVDQALTAESIAKDLGGRKVGGEWLARCPAHDDSKPSLSIRAADDNKILVHCHAGCSQEAVLAALRQRSLWSEKASRGSERSGARPTASKTVNPEDVKRSQGAFKIWQSALPAEGTLVETYVRLRGMHLSLPQTIRFSRRLRHPSGGLWPAMVALVTCGVDDAPLAIHRTFLARDGSDKALVEPQKMMLGPCRGGAVRLAPAGEVLMVGEGIETSLAATVIRPGRHSLPRDC